MAGSVKGIRFRSDSGQSRDRGLLTRGRDAGNDVNRNRVVVGEAVPTLSDDSNVVSTAVLAAVVPVAVVLQYLERDLAVPKGPVRIFGV